MAVILSLFKEAAPQEMSMAIGQSPNP